MANIHSHAADAGDQDGSGDEQVLVLVQIHLLDHLQTGNSDEAVQGDANTAHDAAGDGIQEGHEGSEEGDHDAHDGSGGDGDDGGVAGNGNTANGLTVGGVGAAAEDSTGEGANAVTQQGAVQAGILQQVLANDGGQVLVVSQVLREDHEGHGNIGHQNSGEVAHIQILYALHGLQEGKLRHSKDLHILEQGEVNNGNAAQGKDGGHNIARQDTDDEGDHLGHLLAVGGNDHHHQQGDHGAGKGSPGGGIHDEVGRGAEVGLCAVGEHIFDGSTGQRQADQSHGGSDDGCGHDLIDPVNTDQLDHDGDDHIHQASQGSTDDQTGKTGRCGDRAAESSRHGADEGEGRTQEHGALELGEKLIDDGTDTCAEEGCGLAHAVANDGGNDDGCRQDRQHLLEGEDQQLGKLGFVVNAVNKIHTITSAYILFMPRFIIALRFPKSKKKHGFSTKRSAPPLCVNSDLSCTLRLRFVGAGALDGPFFDAAYVELDGASRRRPLQRIEISAR